MLFRSVEEVIGYLLGIRNLLDSSIPWPASYDMNQTIAFYNKYYSSRPWALEPGMPRQITGDLINKIKQAYENAKNGKDPEYTGVDNIPTPKPTAEPEPEPRPEDEPNLEPQDEPVVEPDEKEPTSDINSSEISPIAY